MKDGEGMEKNAYQRRTTWKIPNKEQNELTKRMLKEGYRLDMSYDELPENVWHDACNFMYKAEYIYTPVWESPCGLRVKTFGDLWNGSCNWIDGEERCYENNNTMFECPYTRECQHRRNDLPRGINCQFHVTEKEDDGSWEKAIDEKRERLRLARERLVKDTKAERPCVNEVYRDRENDVFSGYSFNIDNCLRQHCQNTVCAARHDAPRNLKKVNIFYDLTVTRRWTEGFLRNEKTKVLKGMKVFKEPVYQTDAEIALKMWKAGKTILALDCLQSRGLGRSASEGPHETIFAEFHQAGPNGEKEYEIEKTISNIRIAKSDQRDLMADIAAVREGIEVVHQSDMEKQNAEEKRQAKKAREVAKHLKALKDRNQKERVNYLRFSVEEKLREEVIGAMKKMDEENMEKERIRKLKEKPEQLTLF